MPRDDADQSLSTHDRKPVDPLVDHQLHHLGHGRVFLDGENVMPHDVFYQFAAHVLADSSGVFGAA